MEQLVLDVWVLYEADGFGASADGSSKMVVRGSFVLMYAKPVQSRAGVLQQYARMQHASTSALVTGCLESWPQAGPTHAPPHTTPHHTSPHRTSPHTRHPTSPHITAQHIQLHCQQTSPGSRLYPNQKAVREIPKAQVSTMSFFSRSVLNTASVAPLWHRSHWSAAS